MKNFRLHSVQSWHIRLVTKQCGAHVGVVERKVDGVDVWERKRKDLLQLDKRRKEELAGRASGLAHFCAEHIQYRPTCALSNFCSGSSASGQDKTNPPQSFSHIQQNGTKEGSTSCAGECSARSPGPRGSVTTTTSSTKKQCTRSLDDKRLIDGTGELVFGVARIFASFNDTFVHVTDLSYV